MISVSIWRILPIPRPVSWPPFLQESCPLSHHGHPFQLQSRLYALGIISNHCLLFFQLLPTPATLRSHQELPCLDPSSFHRPSPPSYPLSLFLYLNSIDKNYHLNPQVLVPVSCLAKSQPWLDCSNSLPILCCLVQWNQSGLKTPKPADWSQGHPYCCAISIIVPNPFTLPQLYKTISPFLFLLQTFTTSSLLILTLPISMRKLKAIRKELL